MKTIKVLLLFVILPLLLSGCDGKLELEQNAFVVAIGLDKNEDDLIDVTFQIANPQVGSTERGASQSEPPSDIITITAADILAAKELANSVATRKISFTHLSVIIVGEEFAKTKLFHHILGSSIYDPEMRLETGLIISKEKASEFIQANKPKLETRPHKYYSFLLERIKNTGFSPIPTLFHYFQRGSGELFLAAYGTTERNEKKMKDEDSYIAGQVPQESGDPVQMIGSAVFKDGKMIGKMNGEETRMSLFLRSKGLEHFVTQSYPDPLNKKYNISVKLIKNGPTKVKVNTKTNPIEINVSSSVKLQVFSNPSLTNFTANMENQKRLKSSIKEGIEKKLKKFITKTQREFKTEPFLWSLAARREFWTLEEYEKFNWEKKYQDAKVKVNVDVTIESFGNNLKPPIIKKHDKE